MFLLLSVCYTLVLPLGFCKPIMQLVVLFCKNFGLLSLFVRVYCLKIQRDLNVVSASTLWLTAWIDIARTIGFIDLKNNSARVLMRLIMCSFLTQVWWHAYLSLSAKGKILWLMVIRLCFYPLKRGRLQLVNSWATYPRCQMKKKHPIQLYFGFRCMESWRHHKLVILTEVQSRNKRMTKNGREEGQARTSRHQYPPSIFLSIIKLVFATFFFIQQVASLVKPKKDGPKSDRRNSVRAFLW